MLRKNVNNPDLRRKHRQTDFRDIKLEVEFLGGIIKNKEILEAVYLKFDSEVLTSDRLKWIYDACVELYVEANVLVDSQSFKNLLKGRKKTQAYTVLWKKIKRASKMASVASTVTAMEKLKQLYKARNMSLCANDIISNLSRALNAGDLAKIDSAEESLHYYSELAITKDVRVDEGELIADYSSFKEEYIKLQKNPDSILGVPTGVKRIDEQMVGLRDGEFGLIVGESGSGKSILLMNMAYYGWQTVGDTIVVTIEMPKRQYEQRLYCAISGVEYDAFRKFNITKEQWKRIDLSIERASKNGNKLHIIDMPSGCTIEALRSKIREKVRKHDIKLICIDYLNIVANSSGEIDIGWENQVGLAASLKLDIARGFNIPTWSAAQTNKKGMAFSSHIKDQVDVSLLIKDDENTMETGVRYIEWLKTRDFKGMPITLETNFNVMRFGPISSTEAKKIKQINMVKRRSIKT